jgi:hypothetical protein
MVVGFAGKNWIFENQIASDRLRIAAPDQVTYYSIAFV